MLPAMPRAAASDTCGDRNRRDPAFLATGSLRLHRALPDDALSPDIHSEVSALGRRGLKLQRYFHDGSLAEQIRSRRKCCPHWPNRRRGDAARWCRSAPRSFPRAVSSPPICGQASGPGQRRPRQLRQWRHRGSACRGHGIHRRRWTNERILSDLARRFGLAVSAHGG